MAKKSKTQRAKASAARSARKEQARKAVEEGLDTKDAVKTVEAPKKGLLGKIVKKDAPCAAKDKAVEKKLEKKAEKKVKKPSFLKEVRLELKRVTWPTKQDVIRWSVVVVSALVFFGVYVAILDNLIITPALIGVSSLGALL